MRTILVHALSQYERVRIDSLSCAFALVLVLSSTSVPGDTHLDLHTWCRSGGGHDASHSA
eukprot:363329-Chlamydomonas_euryale.AAC.4